MNTKIKLSFDKLKNALDSLEVMLNKPLDKDRVVIDATIHRFKFTFEQNACAILLPSGAG
ncbi:MAG: hypothetical protein JSS07_00570 [Proteobacteria bacterium]|nr:hypothetical protein [Pseudomonadota bacterium]